jgi:hypothetical protein
VTSTTVAALDEKFLWDDLDPLFESGRKYLHHEPLNPEELSGKSKYDRHCLGSVQRRLGADLKRTVLDNTTFSKYVRVDLIYMTYLIGRNAAIALNSFLSVPAEFTRVTLNNIRIVQPTIQCYTTKKQSSHRVKVYTEATSTAVLVWTDG